MKAVRLLSKLKIVGGQRLQRPSWQACLAGVIDHIRNSYPEGIVFADCAFPRHFLFHALADVQLLRLPENDPVDAFHARFNMGGGTRPVVECSADPLTRLADGKPLCLAVGKAEEAVRLLPKLERLDIRLLTMVEPGAFAHIVKALPALANWSVIRFVLSDGTPTPFVCLRTGSGMGSDRLFDIAKQPMAVQRLRAGLRFATVENLPKVSIAAQSRTSRNLLSQAQHLVTDNAYAAEQHGPWSWLWIGPDQTTRFATGRIPQGAKRLIVQFLPNDLHSGLPENLRLQLDGRHVQHQGEFSPDGSGRAWVELDKEDFTVVSVACRLSRRMEDNGRVLRACVSHMGFAL